MSVSKKLRKKPEEDFSTFTKEELILRVNQLTAHNNQLKNVISKKFDKESTSGGNFKGGKKFDFTKCSKRHIFLKFLYLGWDYQGFATQEDTNKTIEWELFEALRKSCLVDDRTTSNYHRCGRTDKGVSAFGQVISIDVRSRVIKNQKVKNGNFSQSNSDHKEANDNPPKEIDADKESTSISYIEDDLKIEGELEYCKILNRLLPPSIRAIAWSPVPPEESARFNCRKRTYKYFFPRGNLNLQNIERAAEYLIGEHDFRNLCKMDVANGVVNFQRKILSVSIKVVSSDQVDEDLQDKPFEFTFHGNEKKSFVTLEDANCDNVKYGMNISGCASSMPENERKLLTEFGSESIEIVGENDLQHKIETNFSASSDKSETAVNLDQKGSDRRQIKQSPYDMCELTVVGQAFLWHQIRCLVSILFLVGQGKEDPRIVKQLLDVESFPRKPQYGLASEVPLNLFATEFDSSLNWVYDRESMFGIVKDLQKEWTMLSVRSTMIRQMISELKGTAVDCDGSELTNCLLQGVRPRTYIPLLQRNTCESLEDRIDHYVKRKRLEVKPE